MHLHSIGVVAGDVKPENILIGNSLTRMKLADFGFGGGKNSLVLSLNWSCLHTARLGLAWQFSYLSTEFIVVYHIGRSNWRS